MTATRGPTWTEQHRMACEARHVLALPTKAQRNQYLADIEDRRGKPAAEQLRAAVMSEWKASRSPSSPEETQAPAVGGEFTPSGEPAGEPHGVPGHGSFLDPAHAGSLRRVGCVVSGAAA